MGGSPYPPGRRPRTGAGVAREIWSSERSQRHSLERWACGFPAQGPVQRPLRSPSTLSRLRHQPAALCAPPIPPRASPDSTTQRLSGQRQPRLQRGRGWRRCHHLSGLQNLEGESQGRSHGLRAVLSLSLCAGAGRWGQRLASGSVLPRSLRDMHCPLCSPFPHLLSPQSPGPGRQVPRPGHPGLSACLTPSPAPRQVEMCLHLV